MGKLEDKIKEKVILSFEKWRDGGYELWADMENKLYEPDAKYCIQLINFQYRLPLKLYLENLEFLQSKYYFTPTLLDIKVRGNVCNLKYKVDVITSRGEKGIIHVKETARFKSNGEPLGARISEAWILADCGRLE